MYSKSPDDDVFQFLAREYSLNHPIMHIYNETTCNKFPGGFEDGITNGAEWYMVIGKSAPTLVAVLRGTWMLVSSLPALGAA